MKSILVIAVLAVTLQLSNCCFKIPSVNQDCLKLIGTYSVNTNSTPSVLFNFNDASNKNIDGRLTLKKTSGKLGFNIINSLSAPISGFTVEWKGGDNYELQTGSQWSIKCFKVVGDTTTITVSIPACEAGYKATTLKLQVTIDTTTITTHDAGSLSDVISKASC